MNETYRPPSGDTATAGSQAPDDPAMTTGALQVCPPSADLTNPMLLWQPIHASYTWRCHVACSTSAFWPLQAWLTSVIGPVPVMLAFPAEASGDAEAIGDVMPVTRTTVLAAAQLTRSFRSMNRPLPSTRTPAPRRRVASIRGHPTPRIPQATDTFGQHLGDGALRHE